MEIRYIAGCKAGKDTTKKAEPTFAPCSTYVHVLKDADMHKNVFIVILFLQSIHFVLIRIVLEVWFSYRTLKQPLERLANNVTF